MSTLSDEGGSDGERSVTERNDPESVAEALERARLHARLAAAESLAALAALVDAGTLAATGGAARAGRLAPLAQSLEQLRAWLEPDGRADGASVLAALSEALDAEIKRWEERSREDPEARAILRAFLAVREVVWELTSRSGAAGRDAPSAAQQSESGPSPSRIQRVPVEG
jgi:hypothetical protein